jgi:uncharacterized protein YdaL
MEELKGFYESFEIKTARQFKDAVKTMAKYAEQIPDTGALELNRIEAYQLRQTFWTIANCTDHYIKDKELACLLRNFETAS